MASPRDRLLLRTLWATGAPVGEVLALRPRDIRRTAVVLTDVSDARRPNTTVHLTGAHRGLSTELRRWARANALGDDEPLFFSRERGEDGRRKAIDRVRAWQIVTAANRRVQGGQGAHALRPATPGAVYDKLSAEPRPAPGQRAVLDQARLANLGPPLVRAHLVSRPRLVQTLDAVPHHAVTLVAAPAGFGKTTTLATWASQAGERLTVAWLSLGVGDNDAVRFWRGVLAALQALRPELGASAVARLQAGAPIALVVDDLLGDLSGLAEPVVLVLDDYHVIDTPEIHASLATIVRERLHTFHLVISTRADPPLPLARLRSVGQLLELRAAQLSFAPDEAAGLLDAAVGVELSREQVAVLEARTEGWAAGLHLAALSLRARADLPAALAAFAGSDRGIVDYFAEEIIDNLPEQARQFLERTSILERMTPSLCDAVVGQPGSAAVLAVLERSNVFITPVDQGHQWFRYHQLFADALRHRLQRDEPTLLPALHERASTWLSANGLPEPALEHALAAEHWDRAAKLLQPLFRPLMAQGEEMTLRRWLQSVPELVCQQHPILGPLYSLALIMSGDTERLAAFLAAAEPTLAGAGEHEALGAVLSIHAQFAVNVDDVDVALECAGRCLEVLPAQPGWARAQAFGVIAQCHLLRGDPGAAAPLLAQMDAALTRETLIVSWTYLFLSADRSRQLGDLPRAAASYQKALDEIGERTVFARHQAWLGSSAIALQWNHLAEAADCLDRSRDAQRLSGRAYRSIQATGLLQRARVLRARGHLAAANDVLDQAEEAARQQGIPRLERVARAERAWIALLDGRAVEAERWADALDPTALDTYAREPEVLVLARIRRAQGAAAELAPLLENLLAAAKEVGRCDSVIAILLQLGLGREQAGDEQGALDALARAVSLAEPAGYLRVFLDEGEPMLTLLRRLLRRGGAAAYTARLLQAFAVGRERAASMPDLLTPRERDVLRLLAQGLPNRAIAERLVTSEATIKSHVHHLIDKLGAASRTEVLVRARQLGELESVTRPTGAS
jgi:LuxR family maltose regulon positive regulatory protein